MKKKIAVTGGIGSGKSTVLSLLEDAGYPVYSCDKIYQSLAEEVGYVEKIKSIFPSVVANGQIDRARLAKLVFSDAMAREKLNTIAHPLIMERLLAEMNNDDAMLCFAEVPLLLEGDYCRLFDAIIVVLRPMENRVEAVCKRDRQQKENVLARMRAQFDYHSDTARETLANIGALTVENEGTLDELKTKLFSVIRKIEKQQT